jgi:5-formyltetrahydrofolate cyclo-ligase
MLSRRDGLTPEMRRIASKEITARVIAELRNHFPSPIVVGLYATKGSEVETAELDAFFDDNGFSITYPRVVDDRRELVFYTCTRDELVPSRYGLREPPARAPEVELSRIQAFLVPGLAFDRTGGRVGWGRGHYDATLAAAPKALRIGVAFDCQVLDHVPRDPHDALLHAVVTEVATYRTPE